MRIVFHGHPALRTPSVPVGEITQEIRDFAQELLRSLRESEVPGVGLAAPQIGVDIRMIALMTVDEKHRSRPGALPGEVVLESQMPLVLINPEIVDASTETSTAEEGCLSLPGVEGHVTRPTTVTLHATMLDGQEITAECGGLLARCLQHEIDHLDGKLFYDRLSPEEQKKADPQMKKLSKQEAAIRRLLGEEGRK